MSPQDIAECIPASNKSQDLILSNSSNKESKQEIPVNKQNSFNQQLNEKYEYQENDIVGIIPQLIRDQVNVGIYSGNGTVGAQIKNIQENFANLDNKVGKESNRQELIEEAGKQRDSILIKEKLKQQITNKQFGKQKNEPMFKNNSPVKATSSLSEKEHELLKALPKKDQQKLEGIHNDTKITKVKAGKDPLSILLQNPNKKDTSSTINK